MKIKTQNIRYRTGREGIELYPFPTIQLVFNEYGEPFIPTWKIKFCWIWFQLSIESSKRNQFIN